MRKFLFIGVGGSGGATLRYLHDEVLRRIRIVEPTATRLPACFEMLAIDIQDHQDSTDKVRASKLPNFVGLGSSRVKFTTHDSVLTQAPDKLADLTAWRPKPSLAPLNLAEGAGQYRGIGRVVFVNRLDTAADAIRGAVDRLTGTEALEATGSLGPKLGFPTGGEAEDQIWVIVVASLAGGSGSSGALDVCDLVRQLQDSIPALLGPMAVLYAPDVFRKIARGLDTSLAGNTLACMSEFLNAKYWSDSLRLPYAGWATDLVERGPQYPFVIGRGNNTITYGSEQDVFAATALCLSTWAVDHNIQHQLGSYIITTGWERTSTPASTSLPILKSSAATGQMAMSAMGYARLIIGRGRFAEYAAERITRRAIEQLLTTPRAEDVPEQDAIDRLTAGPQITKFLAACQLRERDAEENDVIDFLCPQEELEGATSKLGRDVVRGFWQGGQKGLNISSLFASLLDAIERPEESFKTDWEAKLEERAQKWVEQIQPGVLEVVAEHIASQGVPVTAALVRKARDEIRAAVANLNTERLGLEEFYRNALNKAGSVEGNVATVRATFEQSASYRVRAAIEIRVRELAAELLADLVEYFWNPLVTELDRVRVDLQDEASSLAFMASATHVPERFLAKPNEAYLLETDEWPATFDREIAGTVGRTGDPERAAATLVLQQGGTQLDTEPWSRRLSTSASIRLRLDPTSLRNNAKEWLTSQPTLGIGEYLAAHPNTFLIGDKTSCRRLIQKLGYIMELAEPLVATSDDRIGLIHGETRPVTRVFSGLPVASTNPSPHLEELTNALRAMLVVDGDDRAATDMFKGVVDLDDPTASVVEVNTFLPAYHPMVFSALASLIVTQHAKLGDAFWKASRCRPLEQYLPMSRSVAVSLAQGWMTAMILGLIRFDARGSASTGKHLEASLLKPPRAGVRTSRDTFLAFTHLGPPATKEMDVLAAALEGYPLAEMRWSHTDTSPLAPYERLLELAATGALAQWVETGDSLGGTLADSWADEADPVAARRDWLRTLLAETSYAKLDELDAFEPTTPNPDHKDYLSPPRLWELRHILREATDALHQQVEGVEVRPSQPSGSLWGE